MTGVMGLAIIKAILAGEHDPRSWPSYEVLGQIK
jgi:hypothetical protein